jgi:hypothetical protein
VGVAAFPFRAPGEIRFGPGEAGKAPEVAALATNGVYVPVIFGDIFDVTQRLFPAGRAAARLQERAR